MYKSKHQIMKILKFHIFLLIFCQLLACEKRKLTIEEILTQKTWNIDEIELMLDIQVEIETESLKYFTALIKNFDIEFTPKQELLVKWGGEIYNQSPVFWAFNPEDSTMLFSMDSLKLYRSVKIEEISEEYIVLKGKIHEDTTRIISSEEGTLILKAKEEEMEEDE